MSKQQGFVSLIVASIIMILLTVVVVGFSRAMQKEQRQALDRQLSTQAFYAAETAVNDVYRNISSISSPKNNCDVSDPGYAWMNNGIVDPTENDIRYTCVLINPNPEELQFNNGSINTQTSKIFPVQSVGGERIRSLTFDWTGSDSVNKAIPACSTDPVTLPATRATEIPMLRVDLTRLPTTSSISRSDLINQTSHIYLYPQPNGCAGAVNSVNYSDHIDANEKGQIIKVDCRPVSGENRCTLTLDQLQAVPGQPSDRYFARVKSIYGNVNMRVNGTILSNDPIQFVGAQVVVDATGKASDVLRRIQVHLNSSNSYPVPEYVYQATDGICKTLQVAPGVAENANCYGN